MTHIPYTKNDAFLTQTDWYVSSAGSDSNSGASISFPVKTIKGGIVSKWGTNSPILNQTTTIHILDSQSLGDERIVLSPILSGTATNFVIVGTPANVGGTFAAGTVTVKVRSSAGNDLMIAGVTSGTAGMLVHNATRSSYAFIKSMSGTTATMEAHSDRRVANHNQWLWFSGEGTTIGRPGDTLQLQSVPLLNLSVLHPSGGDSNTGSVNGVCWAQMIHVPDISGTPSNSGFGVHPEGCALIYSVCWLDPFITANSTNSGSVRFFACSYAQWWTIRWWGGVFDHQRWLGVVRRW